MRNMANDEFEAEMGDSLEASRYMQRISNRGFKFMAVSCIPLAGVNHLVAPEGDKLLYPVATLAAGGIIRACGVWVDKVFDGYQDRAIEEGTRYFPDSMEG